MEYVTCRGARIPALGFGTWQLTGRGCREAVSRALDIGYRHFDTAQGYENEIDIGRAVAASGIDRGELWLTTKIGRDELDRESIIAASERSRERLRTEYLDLLLVHWPSDVTPLAETICALGEVRDSGVTRHIGVSNFPPGMMTRALDFESIVCNQVEFHPFLDQDELLSVAQTYAVAIVAYCPLAHGRVMADATLQRIGARHGKSPAQVALRWLLDHSGVAAIPKAARAEHAAANFDIFDFELSPQEQAEIYKLGRGERLLDPAWAPDWTH